MSSAVDRTDAIESWMVSYLADLLDVPQQEVSVTGRFDHFGLDSVAMVAFTSDLGKWLGIHLENDLMIKHQDIQSVAKHVRDRQRERVDA